MNKVKLQSLRKQYEHTMNYDEEIAELFSRLMMMTNQMKLCEEKITEVEKMEKVMRPLTSILEYIVVTIEKSKDLSEMKLEELQTYLEAHELRLKQRSL